MAWSCHQLSPSNCASDPQAVQESPLEAPKMLDPTQSSPAPVQERMISCYCMYEWSKRTRSQAELGRQRALLLVALEPGLCVGITFGVHSNLTLRGREASNASFSSFTTCSFPSTHNRAKMATCFESLSFVNRSSNMMSSAALVHEENESVKDSEFSPKIKF